MRILIISTSDRAGGAAVAAWRLMEALTDSGEKARMLVGDKTTADIRVAEAAPHWRRRWAFLLERLLIFIRLGFRRDRLFDIDTAECGLDITATREFREADVVHIHWTGQGMLSTRGLRKLMRSGKPIVWTMHDIWPATAVCHIAHSCTSFQSGCRGCKLAPAMARSTWKRKAAAYALGPIHFVACSSWLANEARKSALMQGQTISVVPNPIDTRTFRPMPRAEACRAAGLPEAKRIILFVCQRATNPYKGMDYLVEACNILAQTHAEGIAVAILGSHADELARRLPFESFPLGYVADEKRIAQIYSAASVFVLPSLSENLPNTIMEAMACGVPCVGFRVGGIPEMIAHKRTGYVAAYRDAADLARGLEWTLFEADADALRAEALRHVAQGYSERAVAMRYVEIYNQARAAKHYL